MTAQEIGRFAWLVFGASLVIGVNSTRTMHRYGWGRAASLVEAIAYPLAAFALVLVGLIALCT